MMKSVVLNVVVLTLVLMPDVSFAQAGTEPLKLVATIPMPDVQGRIDHLAIDLRGQRLFVAALGNNSVEVLDLKENKRIHTIKDLAEPQGIVYVPATNRVFVANGKDGSVRMFDALSWKLLNSIAYGDDADNLRYDAVSGHIWVGYGSGALGEFDREGAKLTDIKIGAHPESFQLEKNGSRIFVNVPRSRKIAVIDRMTKTEVASWSTGGPLANYPMALDEEDHRLFVVTRLPAHFIVFDTDHGKRIVSLPVVGDCDDVFFDQKRHKIYAIGGDGEISVLNQRDADHYDELARIKTVSGARTGFFSPELDRLFLAVRRQGSQPAEIRVYAPVP
jgi:YVTN family beta-propeller protein